MKKTILLLAILFSTALIPLSGRVSEASKTGGKKPELVIQEGHSKFIHSVAFSSNGKYLASAGEDSLMVWDVGSGRLIRKIDAFVGMTYSVAFSANNKILAAAGCDEPLDCESDCKEVKIKLWDSASGKLIRTVYHQSYWIEKVLFSPDGEYFIAAVQDKGIWIWKTEDWSVIARRKTGITTGMVFGFAPGGKNLWIVEKEGQISLRRLPDWKLLKSIDVGAGTINGIAVSPDKNFVAVISAIGPEYAQSKIIVFDVSNKSCVFTSNAFSFASFSHDGRYLICGGTSQRIWILSTETWELSREVKISKLGLGRYWDLESSPTDPLWVLVETPEIIMLGLEGDEKAMILEGRLFGNTVSAFSPDKLKMAFGFYSPDFHNTCSERNLFFWDFELGRNICLSSSRSTCSGNRESDDRGTNEIWFSDDSSDMIATGSRRTQRWEISASEPANTEGSIISSSRAFDYSPISKVFLTWELRSSIMVRDSKTGDVIFEEDASYPLVISRGGGLLAAMLCEKKNRSYCERGTLTVWKLPSGDVLKNFPGIDDLDSLALSDDEKMLAAGSWEKGIYVWNLETGAVRVHIERAPQNYASPTAIEFSPDGSSLAAVDNDAHLKLWKTLSGEQIWKTDNKEEINSIAWLAGGKILAATDASGRIKFRDSRTGKLLLTQKVFYDGEWIAFTPTGQIDSSPNGKGHVSWTVGMESYPAEKFWEEFYRPGLLRDVISGKEVSR